MRTRKTAVLRVLRLRATIDGKAYKHHVKVGFSVDKIQPWTKEPKDFKAFWDKQLADLADLPLTYTKELAKEYCTASYAYLFEPKNALKGSCPAVHCPPGAGIKTIKEPLRHRYYADNGCIRMEMEIHGLDPRLPQEAFDDLSRAYNGKENGYLNNGLDDKDRYYMKRVYLSLIRAIDLMTSLPEWDGKNVIVQGGSQGGALSIVAAGLDSRVTQCIANHPALSDMAAYSAGLTGGYPHYNRVDGIFTKANIETMAYYDVVNFARYVTADTYMTWGYNDDVCPPTTSIAACNTHTCPKEALLTPINEHFSTDDTEKGHCTWMLKHLK